MTAFKKFIGRSLFWLGLLWILALWIVTNAAVKFFVAQQITINLKTPVARLHKPESFSLSGLPLLPARFRITYLALDSLHYAETMILEFLPMKPVPVFTVG